MAQLEQTGIEFVAEGAEAFKGAIDGASSSMKNFEDQGASTEGSFNAFQEVVTGALREVGTAAVEMAVQAGEAVVEFAKNSFEEALKAEQGMTRLEGAIKRAGAAAPVTKEQALKLADSMKNLAGGSDEAIIGAEGILLKFQNIGKDIFPEALKTSTNLAAVLGTDVSSAAEQLGRALENPIAATRLLRQAGIALTADEKAKLKAMQESGDAMGAQQFILDKLAKTTEGAAEQMAGTTAGQWQIFTETIQDAGRGIAESFLPVIKVLMDDYLKPLLPVITDIASVIAGQLSGAFSGFNVNLGGIQATLQPITDALRELFAAFASSAPQMQAIGKDLFSFLGNEMGITLPNVIKNLADIIRALAEIWREHGTTIMTVIEFAFKFIAATIAGTMTLITGIVSVAMTVIGGVFDFWSAIFSGNWSKAWNIILDTVQKAGNTIIDTVKTFIDESISIVTTGMQNTFNSWVMQITGGMQSAIINAINAARGLFGAFVNVGDYLMIGIKDGIYMGIHWVLNAARDVAQAAVNEMKSILGISSPSSVTMELIGKPFAQGIAQGISGNTGLVTSAASAIVQAPMMAGQIGGSSSVSSVQTQNYNLSVNSQQQSQGIVSDFSIMQAMAA